MEIRQEEEFIIIDEVLSKNSIENFQNVIIPHLQYNIGDTYKGTSGLSNNFFIKNEIKNIYEQFQFSYTAYNSLSPTPFLKEEHYHLLSLPLTLACIEMGWTYTSHTLLRIKANLQTQAPKEFKGYYNEPHTDLNKDHFQIYPNSLTAIYYVNDSDGDTVFFEEEGGNSHFYNIDATIKKYNNLTIKKTIPPKENKMVIFPSHILHSGSHPVNHTLRSVINYNFQPITINDPNSRE